MPPGADGVVSRDDAEELPAFHGFRLGSIANAVPVEGPGTPQVLESPTPMLRG